MWKRPSGFRFGLGMPDQVSEVYPPPDSSPGGAAYDSPGRKSGVRPRNRNRVPEGRPPTLTPECPTFVVLTLRKPRRVHGVQKEIHTSAAETRTSSCWALIGRTFLPRSGKKAATTRRRPSNVGTEASSRAHRPWGDSRTDPDLISIPEQPQEVRVSLVCPRFIRTLFAPL